MYEVKRSLEEPQFGSSLLKGPEAKSALTSDFLLDEVKQKQTYSGIKSYTLKMDVRAIDGKSTNPLNLFFAETVSFS